MSRRTFRTALIVVAATLAVAGGVAAWFVHEALKYPDIHHHGKGVEVEVEIKRGMSFPQIASELATRGVVAKPSWFRLYAMYRGVTAQVRAGKYVLRDDLTPQQVLDQLLEGVKEVTVKVTIPEGLHMLEIFQIIEKAGVAKAVDLEATARDPEFLASHGIAGDNPDGYLYPDSYNFVVPTRPAQVIERLINRHREVWNEVIAQSPKALKKLKERLKWSDRDVLILASIVEKEAVAKSEQPVIAEVFINRITSSSFKPHNLDTDPTIRYGCMVPRQKSAACAAWDPSDRLHRAQLDDKDNPYNTYQHEGLPPGPISNPGRGAIAAAINPDDNEYFFFVSRNDGTHVFARTRAEHERNVDQFQR
jgi:UPF0755 protein